MLKYYYFNTLLGMGTMGLPKNMFLISVLAIVSIGITAGSVVAVQTFTSDVIIEAGGGESGNLLVNDGNLGIHAIPSDTQVISAKNKPGSAANFLVFGDKQSAVFSLKSKGAQAAIQLSDGDTNQVYRIRIAQPDTDRLEFVDITAGVARMTIDSNGNICIGNC